MISKKEAGYWLRQAKLKAKRDGANICLNIEDILKIIDESNHCNICNGDESLTLSTLFDYKDGVECSPANIIVCCKECKQILKKNGILDLCKHERYKEAMTTALSTNMKRDGGKELKDYIRRLMGYE